MLEDGLAEDAKEETEMVIVDGEVSSMVIADVRLILRRSRCLSAVWKAHKTFYVVIPYASRLSGYLKPSR